MTESMNRLTNEWRWREKIALGVLIGGFGVGVANHAGDFVMCGWRPYSRFPPILEAFWTSLILLDLAVVALLLLGRRRAGLTLALAIMILDVSINSYASLSLEIPGFETALPLQAVFLGFVIGSTLLLWPSTTKRL